MSKEVYEMFGFGYRHEQRKKVTPEEEHLGKEVCVHSNGNMFYGVLKKVDFQKDVLYLNPHLTSDPGMTDVRLLKDNLSVSIYNHPVVRPLWEGCLNEFVKKRKKGISAEPEFKIFTLENSPNFPWSEFFKRQEPSK